MTIPREFRRTAAVAATALAVGLCAFAAAPAQASTTDTSAPATAAAGQDNLVNTASGTSSLPGAPADVPASLCNWNPTVNSKIRADYSGTGVNIRTGPSTGCTPIGEGEPGDNVWVHCYYPTGQTFVWLYLTDYTRGKKGWSYGQYVINSGIPAEC